MRVAIVTPARNEATNLPHVARALCRLRDPSLVSRWIIVDDGSTDGTSDVARGLNLPFELELLSKANDGGLRGGSAFSSFFAGADYAIGCHRPDETHVMKLDADALLSSDFFDALSLDNMSGLSGGIAVGAGDVEQQDLVPGFCKVYSIDAYEVIRRLPPAIGLDVIDQVALEAAGFSVVVTRSAHVRLIRSIGYSEGIVRGRRRNGIVSRWVGYDPVYFFFRLLRYSFRRPLICGALAMLSAYAKAGNGPYPNELKRRYRAKQREKLRVLVGRPSKFFSDLYGHVNCSDRACCAGDRIAVRK